jgi:hypothetical protein
MNGAAEVEVGMGLTALVDADVVRWLRLFRWRLTGTAPKWYAKAYIPAITGEMLMHRILVDPPAGLVVDHINGDGLDNRRVNLRACTQAENMRNVRRWRTLYPGLRKNTKGQWIARVNGRRLGPYRSMEDAGAAFQQAMRADLAARLACPAPGRPSGRPPKPWFRAERDVWVATVAGRRHVLARGREAESEALARLARILAENGRG